MKRVTLLGGFFILALALVACAPAATATPETTDFPTQAPTLSVPVTGDTETPVVSTTDTASGTSTAELPVVNPTTDAGAGAGFTIMTSGGVAGNAPFLVDAAGRTLYLFTNDTQNSGTSTCTGDCLADWPPVIVTGVPQAGTGVNASMLGTIPREDGTLQATYNGWPLYYYADDLNPGDVSGQGMNNVWFVVSAEGNAIEESTIQP